MRGIIRERLAAGDTPEQVKAYFVEKYGVWILLAPPRQGFNLLVWVVPFVALGAGPGAGRARWCGAGAGGPPTPRPSRAPDAAMRARIHREMAEREPMTALQITPDRRDRGARARDRAVAACVGGRRRAGRVVARTRLRRPPPRAGRGEERALPRAARARASTTTRATSPIPTSRASATRYESRAGALITELDALGVVAGAPKAAAPPSRGRPRARAARLLDRGTRPCSRPARRCW